jgi:hypothetical protein
MNLKRIYIVFLMMLFAFSASAQSAKVSFGITGGGIATQMLTEPQPSSPMYISGYGGVFATVSPHKKMGVRVGANYSMQGGNYEMAQTPINLSQTYLNVPASLMYHIKSYISLEAGFYQNILLNASLVENGKTTVTVNPDDGALKYNIGVLAGAAININKYLFINLRYCYGLSNSYAIMGTGYKSNAITAGLGVNIIRTKSRAF